MSKFAFRARVVIYLDIYIFNFWPKIDVYDFQLDQRREIGRRVEKLARILEVGLRLAIMARGFGS